MSAGDDEGIDVQCSVDGPFVHLVIREIRSDGGHAMSHSGGDEFPIPDVHPGWCNAPQRCFVNDEGVSVHVQKPTCLEIRDGARLRFETSLVAASDEPTPYLSLRFRDLRMRDQFYGLIPLDAATALRDQLTEHLDAVERSRQGATR